MLRLTLQKSLAELRTHNLHVYYLGPDRSVPQSDIFCGINAVHQEGLFAKLGVTCLPAWEVAQICELCDREGWVKPSVYQGKYNVLHRAVEPGLFPRLRHYGIKFYAFNPIAGGFLAGGESHKRNKNWGYGNEEYFAVMELLDPVVEKHELTLRECALRWLADHSLLGMGKGDAVLMGASGAAHLESNLVDLEKGPLPDVVVGASDRGVRWKY
ncbi:hypothetical protein HO173_008181 [Letharia columbiana]|uniref:NADP-dependent oxidoreductase domain-containing protein n=1 Tax=Letharia columbiana TaxID=112416 RepID=A0A8H6L316_9LECA|nr:uncharacterized protein HO173_008181 [Letharia columbiana]KAF6233624.1 hypothetical protein HO173_008181 [Letharia columbiana]